MKWILLLIVFGGCSGASIAKKQIKNESLEFTVFNGKIKYIQFPLLEDETSGNIVCKEQGSKKPLVKKMPFLNENGVGKLYYAESYHSLAKLHYCFLGKRKIFTVKVKSFPYKVEHLKVARSKVILSKKDQARAAREWHLTQKIYKNAYKGSYIRDSFQIPLQSFITSYYGKRRIFNKVKKTQHLGNDFRAKVGVPIPASNRGKVVFAGDLFYTGNVVILDHGLGIFSLYAHLSRTMVKAGDIIDKATIVGLSGMTGRVSGPHLHWGVKIHGHNVDGFSLVSESKQQFIANAKVH